MIQCLKYRKLLVGIAMIYFYFSYFKGIYGKLRVQNHLACSKNFNKSYYLDIL